MWYKILIFLKYRWLKFALVGVLLWNLIWFDGQRATECWTPTYRSDPSIRLLVYSSTLLSLRFLGLFVCFVNINRSKKQRGEEVPNYLS